ncbi:hypothetical protein FACS1894132_02390 [Clostridia bacterium]|nr:hypothetical protein FACS1894132_02390 [Clostridia bacterium]
MGWLFKSKVERESKRVAEEEKLRREELWHIHTKRVTALNYCKCIVEELGGKYIGTDYKYEDERVSINRTCIGCKVEDKKHGAVVMDWHDSDSGHDTFYVFREGSWMEHVSDLYINEAEPHRRQRLLEQQNRAREAAELAFKPID